MAKASKPHSGSNRVPLMVRTSPQFRAKLEDAAANSGRSLGQEAELRLERSFDPTAMVESAARTTADLAMKFTQDHATSVERNILELVGGDNLFMIWSALSWVVGDAERETGKSIREDEFTKNLAERKLLGAIPGLFRSLPGSYSDFKARARSRGPTPLGALAEGFGAQLDSPLPPLGWKGAWPPEQE